MGGSNRFIGVRKVGGIPRDGHIRQEYNRNPEREQQETERNTLTAPFAVFWRENFGVLRLGPFAVGDLSRTFFCADRQKGECCVEKLQGHHPPLVHFLVLFHLLVNATG